MLIIPNPNISITTIGEVNDVDFSQDRDDYPETGPYMTIADFYRGVECGAYGPDESCYWVTINGYGCLVETLITSIYAQPDDAIAVAYYPQ